MEKKYLNDSGLMHFWGKIKSYIKSVSDALQGQIDDNQQQITANKSAQDTKNASLDENMTKLNTRDDQITETLKNITVTGGASVASAVTYDNTTSKLTSANIQGAVDELQGAKIDKTSILQESGDAEDKVMSQKATTTAIADEVARAKAAEEAIIFDVSANNNDAVFESISALLNSSDLSILIPTSVRRGGMSIRFIQGYEQSSDNKYVQYRLMADSFSITVADWQGVDDEPTVGSDNLVKSGGVANKISELKTDINGLQYSKSYSYNVNNRPSSSVAANPVIVDFKAPCTIEFGVKGVSFPDDIVNIILYLRDADGNVMNGNGTTLNNNDLVKFDAVKDIKYITMYSNNLFLRACTMTIVAKKVGDGLKQKIESLEKDLTDIPINDVEDEVRNLTLNTVGKYDFNIDWISGKYINKEGKLVDISANIYATEKYYRVNPNDVIFSNCICYGDTCIAFYNSDKKFVEYIQQFSVSSGVIHVPDNDEIKYARFTHRVDTVQIADVYCYKKKDNNMQAEIDRVYAISTKKQPSAKIINFDKFSGDGWSVLENKISATTTSNNSLSYPISWAEQDSVFAVNAVVEGSTFEFGFGKYAISTDAGTKVYGSMFGVRKTASGDYLVTYQGDWEERNVLPLDNVKLTSGKLITISVREYISETFAGRVFDITLVDNNGNKDIVTNVGSSYPYINGKALFDKGYKITSTGQNCGYPIFKMISGSRLTIRNFSFSFPKGNDTKLLICGHSYVEGNSLQGQGNQINCFASKIKKELPTSQVLGWGGDDFTRFETYYRTLLDWFPKTEYMLICLGGNDKYNGVKAYSTTEGQNWLVDKIKSVNSTLKSYNVIPVWVTLNPLKLDGFSEPTIVNNYIKSNVLSVDVVDLFYKGGSFVEGAFLPDNVHPTKEVHAKILERIKTQASYLFVDI